MNKAADAEWALDPCQGKPNERLARAQAAAASGGGGLWLDPFCPVTPVVLDLVERLVGAGKGLAQVVLLQADRRMRQKGQV